MAYELSSEMGDENQSPTVVFLYRLTSGACSRSLGMNVARMAGLPAGLVERAQQLADEFAASMATAKHSVQALQTTSQRYSHIIERCKLMAAQGDVQGLRAQLAKLQIR